jgi:hypothetical protein
MTRAPSSAKLSAMPARRTNLGLSAALFLAAAMLPAAARSEPEAPPRPPCAAGAPLPAYAEVEAAPAVAIWHDLEFIDGPDCLGRLQGRMKLVAALAARFRHDGSLDDLAARLGDVSKTIGLIYWSTGEQKWRNLISDAAALTQADPGARRHDFTAEELRSGETLWFMQNDTRSTGENLYSLRSLASEDDRLVVEVVNESAIVFTFVTLFSARDLYSLHFLQRLDGDIWGYYGLAAMREGSVSDYEKSMVNRAAAYYRFLIGRPGDSGEPLAR